MTEKITQIVKLFEENAEAEKALSAIKDVDEAIALLAQYGIELSREEFEKITKEIGNDELSEEMLSMVAGGSWYGKAWKGVKNFFQGFLDAF